MEDLKELCERLLEMTDTDMLEVEVDGEVRFVEIPTEIQAVLREIRGAVEDAE